MENYNADWNQLIFNYNNGSGEMQFFMTKKPVNFYPE